MLDIGVVSRAFGKLDSRKAAEKMRELGFRSTELCFTGEDADFWCYNGHRDLSGLTDRLAADVINAYRDNGIKIVSLGAFSSLFEPDEEAAKQNLDRFERYFQIAAANGVGVVATESGFVPGRRGINTDSYETDFDRFKKNLCIALRMAEKYGVDLALEPCVLDITPSAKRTRDLITQSGSPRLKVLLDPANLIANSDEDDMYKYLAPHIAYFHGKDRKVNDTYGRVVGDGDIDWVKFLRLYHDKCEGIPFLIEYVNQENCAEIRDRLAAYNKVAENI